MIGKNDRAYFSNIDSVNGFPKYRYGVFRDYCRGKIVGDIACGSGYGSYILSEVSKYVYGYDLYAPALDYARKHHSRENIEYGEFDIVNGVISHDFDVIVSCETLEHLPIGIDESILRLSSMLLSGGILCITHPENESKEGCAPGHLVHGIKNVEVCSYLESIGYDIEYSEIYLGLSSLIVGRKR